ncbi:hypothetical protein EON79_10710 [bacterium]|nr:MAG: hypothetical protein EON79_10710 [bacterium]
MKKNFVDSDHPCPFCGNTEFILGHLEGHGGVWTFFEADGRGFMDGLSGVKKGDVRSRMCTECRHLDLFVPDYQA